MRRQKIYSFLISIGLLAGSAMAQQPASKKAESQAVAPQAASNPVVGSGTPGRLSRWSGVSGSSTYALGDSVITEDKFGNVGVGTTLPTSKLTIQGLIETSGGVKFPDGTVQTTAGLATVVHDETLTGNGTPGSPLSVVQSEALIEPIRESVSFSIDPGFFAEDVTLYTVPTGKRLIIEHVSASCSLPAGQRVRYLEILPQPAGGLGTLGSLSLVPTYLGDFSGKSEYRASTPMKLYGHSETGVRVFVERSVNTGEAFCSFTISGFLVNLP